MTHINFCSQCGHKTETKIPANDNRIRAVCPNGTCGVIHYENPKIITGIIPILPQEKGGFKILLCKRAIEPRYGFWTLPAGFMENGESSKAGGLRELHEESGAVGSLENTTLFTVIDVPKVNQVHLFYLCFLTENTSYPTNETLETKWFDCHENDIPWQDLAFDTVRYTIKHLLNTQQQFMNLKNLSVNEQSIKNPEKNKISQELSHLIKIQYHEVV
jgi:ADP-ribose pyrophosphatase YjhB (NUDIX family)